MILISSILFGISNIVLGLCLIALFVTKEPLLLLGIVPSYLYIFDSVLKINNGEL